MQIRFLGTGAADWKGVPPSFPGYRFFTSALIDGCLLIDPGPDVFDSAAKFGTDLSGIRWIINTHSHADHFSEETLEKLTGNGAVFIRMKEGESSTPGKYTITAFAANHGTCPGALHFSITDGEKRLYYALDSAWLQYPEYVALKTYGADLIVLDGTIGDVPGDYRIFEHNNLNMIREMKQTLSPYVKRFIISHMALTLHDPHEKLAENMARSGIEVAYDGLTVTI